MSEPLDLLLHDGIIEAVISRLKSGKEADIYLVQQPGEIVAAKIYKERNERSFKNNAAYLEGRTVRNTRTQRAMQKGTRFGRQASEQDWKARESDALHKLHAAGVRVPQPVLFYEGVLLMEVVVDPSGHPAPRLVDAHLDRSQAAALYADLRRQIVTMLTCDVIHGDLSPYNVLMAWNGPTVIDFPQLVDAAHNRQSQFFFERDLQAIRRFFAALDPSLSAHADDGRQIWRAWERRELTPDFVPVPRRPQREGAPRNDFAPPPRPVQPPQQRGTPKRNGAPRQGGSGDGAPQQRGAGFGPRNGAPRQGAPAAQQAPQQRGGSLSRNDPARQGPRNPQPRKGDRGPRPGRRDDRVPRMPQVSYVGQVPTPPAPAEAPAPASSGQRRRRRRGGKGKLGGSSGPGQPG